MSAIVDIASWVCLVAGGFFCLVGGIGLLRMPDFYTRMHGASITETLGAGFLLAGMMLHAGLTLVSVKLAMIGLLMLVASPTATHALARAALSSGLRPKTGANAADDAEEGADAEQHGGEEVDGDGHGCGSAGSRPSLARAGSLPRKNFSTAMTPITLSRP